MAESNILVGTAIELVDESKSSAIPQSCECEDTDTVTALDLDAQFELDARQAQALAARAGQRLDSCSYSNGYHAQPVYWCRSCHPHGDVGICLGCSMNCHLDHEVEELFEKRAFRCDCGNKKSGAIRCTLESVKEEMNHLNRYNHNFKGEYCYCNGRYQPESDIMFSCILCQDWFHDRCADTKLEDGGSHHSETDDFICRVCLAKPENDILIPYIERAMANNIVQHQHPAKSETTTPTVARTVNGDRVLNEPIGAVTTTANENSNTAATAADTNTTITTTATTSSLDSRMNESELLTPSRKRKIDDISTEASDSCRPTSLPLQLSSSTTSSFPHILTHNDGARPASSTPSGQPVVCTRPTRSTSSSDTSTVTITDRFIPGDWNLALCLCPSCMVEYRNRHLDWLTQDDTDPTSTVLNDMTEADSNAPLETAFDTDAITAAVVDRMDRGTVLDIIGPLQLFQASIKRQLGEFVAANPGKPVSADVMKTITETAKVESKSSYQQAKRARLNDQLAAE